MASDPVVPDVTGAAAAKPSSLDPARRRSGTDGLRGFAILGILAVNISLMSAPLVFLPPDQVPGGGFGSANDIASGVVAWLFSGKFISMLAILFGAGMGIMATRMLAQGRLRRVIFLRRSIFLLVLGLAHMLLLFPGDVLFTYGITCLLAMIFLRRSVRTLLWWAGGIAAFGLALSLLLAAASLVAGSGEGLNGDPDALALVQSAYATRDYADVILSNAIASAVVQIAQAVFGQVWILPLFLVGMAAAKAGVVSDPAAHRLLLRRLMVIGLAVGLPLNAVLFSVGLGGVFGLRADDTPVALALVLPVITTLGAPLLAVGYASVLTLLWLRVRPPAALVNVGRMALTAYLLQSVLGFAFFFGTGLYGDLGFATALLVVPVIWVVLLVVCTLWLRRFNYGPLEWVLRLWTYLRIPPRAAASDG